MGRYLVAFLVTTAVAAAGMVCTVCCAGAAGTWWRWNVVFAVMLTASATGLAGWGMFAWAGERRRGWR